MTQSVAQKTSIPEKAWRRQTDSPTWWITFACGSVILHLLALWLVGLYKLNSSQVGRSQSAVAIEFIEISPQKSYKVQPKPKPKPKAVSPKPATPIVPQKPQPTANLSTQLPPVSTNNSNAIAFDNQKIEQQLQRELAQQRQREAELQRQLEAQQRQREAEFQRQLEAQQRLLAQQQRLRIAQQQKLEAQLRQREAEQQRLLAEQIRQQEAEQQRQIQAQRQREAEQQRQIQAQRQREAEQQRQIEAQRQREAEQQRQIEAQRQQEAEERQKLLVQRLRQTERSQQNQNPSDGENITDAIKNRVGQTPQQRQVTPQAPIKETQLNQSGGILTASWDLVAQTRNLIKDIPANLPKPKEDISKSFVIPSSEQKNLSSANFQVYLYINEEGKVEFTKVDQNLPAEKRQQYQAYVDKEFLHKKLFYPATDPDPRTGELKPRRGELFIRIKILRGY
ncbi:MAG: hypothetical protein AAFW70_17015 [Cyanobacteria bacterium J06635_10]